MNKNIYKQAVRQGLRFKVGNSTVSTEDLFSFPTRSKNGRDLNTTYQNLFTELEAARMPSLDGKMPSTTKLTLQYDIIRDVYQTKLAEEAKAKQAKANRALKADLSQRAVEILNNRTTDKMSKMSDAELLALI